MGSLKAMGFSIMSMVMSMKANSFKTRRTGLACMYTKMASVITVIGSRTCSMEPAEKNWKTDPCMKASFVKELKLVTVSTDGWMARFIKVSGTTIK